MQLGKTDIMRNMSSQSLNSYSNAVVNNSKTVDFGSSNAEIN